MKKKITAICLCVALLAIAVVSTLAYFTDNDSAKNTFTVGNVSIDLIESRFHREGNDNSGDASDPRSYPYRKRYGVRHRRPQGLHR